MYLTDFHIHSTHSDGKLRIPELVDLYGKRGFGAIAITDHLCEEKTLLGKAAAYLDKTLKREGFQNYIEEVRSEAARAWDQYKMRVIPGFEITKNSLRNHRSAHVLALGVEEYIAADLEIEDISKKVRGLGGLLIAAHPISNAPIRNGNYFIWDQKQRFEECFDAWEMTDNGRILEPVVRSRLPKIANSDLHRPEQLRSWKTLFECERHPGAIFRDLKQQKLRFQFYEAA